MFPFAVLERFGEQAGAVLVEGWVAMLAVELVDRRRPALGDVEMAEVLAYDMAVLAFSQGIVVALPGARPGELGAQFVQQGALPQLKCSLGLGRCLM